MAVRMRPHLSAVRLAALALLYSTSLSASVGDVEIKSAKKQTAHGSLANIRYEPLAAGQWKMLNVGAANEQLNLPYGKSFYAVVALPPIEGTVELRAQMPWAMKEIHDSLMPCVTFLNAQFKPTHSFDYRQAYLPPTLGWRFNDTSAVEIRVSKNAIDRYMIVHTDTRVIGSVVKYDLGHPTSTLVPMGKYNYMAPGPSSVGLRVTARGKVRVKLFPR